MSSKPTFEPGFIEFFIALMLPLIMGGLAVFMALNIQGCSSSVEGIGYESESLKELAWNPPPGGEDETLDPSGESPDDTGQYDPEEPPWQDPAGTGEEDGEGGLENSGEEADVPGVCVPGTGCWGEPCEEDSDCQSGVCVIHLGEGQCSDVCDAECPEGFSCVIEPFGGPDPASICVSDHAKLCEPCTSSLSCGSDSPIESTCMVYGSWPGAEASGVPGSFCATWCSEEHPCPASYLCVTGESASGDEAAGCVHEDLVCSCSSTAIESGATTVCAHVNWLGECAGERSCTEDGLSDCDAPIPASEICDGFDQDCDDTIDEAILPITCGLGACEHSVPSCTDGSATSCDPMEGAAPETCDGVDEDCDGVVDNGLGELTCGEGACAHSVPACTDGVSQVCDPFEGATEETCDGFDNDCDGVVDEVDAIGCTFFYLDADDDDHGSGVPKCLCAPEAGHEQTVASDCDDGDSNIHPGAVETCDGVDEDCDGITDEDLGSLTCGQGICHHTIALCAGGLVQTCDPLEGQVQETCDGLDNDCDGSADEDLGATTCGLGVCLKTIENCVAGAPQSCDPTEGATPETCDNLDNDCDGKVDEGLGKTSCGVGQCAKTIANCAAGAPQTCDPTTGASAEVCDGVDNDCDGKVDEGLGKISCGKGVCAKSINACAGGAPQTCDPKGGATTEICDGLDNDCDGKVDEGQGKISCGKGVCAKSINACAGGAPQTCDPKAGASAELCDGLDNDCDGQVDEGLACGVPNTGGCP